MPRTAQKRLWLSKQAACKPTRLPRTALDIKLSIRGIKVSNLQRDTHFADRPPILVVSLIRRPRERAIEQ